MKFSDIKKHFSNRGAATFSAAKLCENSIACLKGIVKNDEPTVEVDLSDSSRPVCRQLDDNLTVCYLFDRGDDYQFVTLNDMKQAGLTGDELHAKAVKNLARHVWPKIEIHQTEGIYALLCGGCFEASVILISEFWSQGIPQLAEKGLIATLPARDMLAFCHPDSPDGVATLRTVCGRVWPSGDHLLTNDLYKYQDSEWRVWSG